MYLFPLNIVLFPESRIRLHIFEPRYKYMIAHCVEQDERFGIVFVDDMTMSTIGCTAHVLDVAKRYPDGTFDIIVEGEERFQIVSSEHTKEDLLTAEIEVIRDMEDHPGWASIEYAISLYNKLITAAYKGKLSKIDYPEGEAVTKGISYQLAEKSGLSLQKRQELLEIVSEAERLRIVTEHISQTLPVIQAQDRIRSLVMNDGYLPRPYT